VLLESQWRVLRRPRSSSHHAIAHVAETAQIFRRQVWPTVGLLNNYFHNSSSSLITSRRASSPEMMSVERSKVLRETVDHAENCRLKTRSTFREWQPRSKIRCRALLHFVGGAIRERDHDQARQPFRLRRAVISTMRDSVIAVVLPALRQRSRKSYDQVLNETFAIPG